MSSPHAAPLSAPPLCPLAVDPDGNPIALPTGAIAWRVRRHTGGRPRIQLGVDKQPMQLPLTYTMADLEDILPPGAYRLDLVDAKGEALGLTIPIAIGQMRNAGDDDEPESGPHAPVSTMLPHTGSDTRLVLEANVRAMQLSFQHNQRTLELGLRTAETLRDGVQVLASAQADWIKSISSSRGFFRNAPPMLPAPQTPEQPAADRNDDDEDEDDDRRPSEQDWMEKFGPMISIVVQQVVTSLAGRFSAPSAPSGGDAKPTTKFEFADLFDWRRVQKKAIAARADAAAAESAGAATPTVGANGPASLLSALPPALIPKLMQAKAMLTADEQQRAMQVLMAFAPADVPILVEHLEAMPVEDIVAFLRAQLEKTAG